MEHHVRVSINAPEWESVNPSQFTHYPPKLGYTSLEGSGGSLTTTELFWPSLSTGWDLQCFYRDVPDQWQQFGVRSLLKVHTSEAGICDLSKLYTNWAILERRSFTSALKALCYSQCCVSSWYSGCKHVSNLLLFIDGKTCRYSLWISSFTGSAHWGPWALITGTQSAPVEW